MLGLFASEKCLECETEDVDSGPRPGSAGGSLREAQEPSERQDRPQSADLDIARRAPGLEHQARVHRMRPHRAERRHQPARLPARRHLPGHAALTTDMRHMSQPAGSILLCLRIPAARPAVCVTSPKACSLASLQPAAETFPVCCTRAPHQRGKDTELGQAAASAGPCLVGDHHGDAERLGQVLQRRSLLACQGAQPLMLQTSPLLSMLMSTKQCADISNALIQPQRNCL